MPMDLLVVEKYVKIFGKMNRQHGPDCWWDCCVVALHAVSTYARRRTGKLLFHPQQQVVEMN